MARNDDIDLRPDGESYDNDQPVVTMGGTSSWGFRGIGSVPASLSRLPPYRAQLNPPEQAAFRGVPFGNINVGNTSLTPDRNGNVNPTAMRNHLIKLLETSRLNGFVPSDGARYGIRTGSPQEWANYFVGLGFHESALNINSAGDHGRSLGMFQLSTGDAVNYRLNGGKPFTLEQLRDPATNAAAALAIQERLILKTASIKRGAGQYWGPIGGQHGEDWTPGLGRDFNLPWKEWAQSDEAGRKLASPTPAKASETKIVTTTPSSKVAPTLVPTSI